MNLNFAEIRMMVHVVTKKTGAPVHDEDLEQQIALNALEAFRRLGPVAHPKALLMKIVYDAVRDHWRRRRSSEDIHTIDERLVSHAPAFEADLDARRKLELLRSALDRIPASKRSLLELFYTHGRSIAEIAALQGKSISAVKMQLARSRQSLARIIQALAKTKSHKSR
jgi:RNA polymerase sigma factor (sigma-70 family)